jgi:hypothetical protein
MIKITQKQIGHIRRQPEIQNWVYLLKKYLFPESILEEFSEYFLTRKKWEGKQEGRIISKYQKLSENFIRKYIENLDFGEIINNQKLSPNFLFEFKDYPIWYSGLDNKQKLTEDLIAELNSKKYKYRYFKIWSAKYICKKSSEYEYLLIKKIISLVIL